MGRLVWITLILGLVVLVTGPARAQTSPPFDGWLAELRAEALERGISAEILQDALIGVAPIPRVIELDRSQPEFTLTLDEYLDRVVPASRVQKGREMLAANRALLDEIGGAFGVQPRFIVALWGIETEFGRITGGFPVIASLVTLAHDGRRSEFFRKELFDALIILDQGNVTVEAMFGSWAGAMGQSQFMPSSFLGYAVDYDGDGRRDIWTTPADVFASAANYLSNYGWADDQTWGREVQLPDGFNPALLGLDTRKRLSEWQALGVRRADGRDLPARDLMGSIVMPDDEGPRSFVVYENFRTILKWNRSTYFGVAVGRLADRISGG